MLKAAVMIEEDKPVLPEVAAELVSFRKEAVEERRASGIEAKWQYAEDAYNGQDEVTASRASMYKPATIDGGFIAISKSSWSRSVAFLNITRPYADASAARTADMLFPTDERNWELKPSPKQDIEEVLAHPELIPDEMLPAAMEIVQMGVEEAIVAVGEAERQIADWLSEVDYPSIGRKALNDAARIGTGVIKGPVPMDVHGKIQPGSKVVRAQDCYPDPNCGDDVQNGEYFFEKESIAARKLRKRVKMEGAGWIPSAIISCLKEGPKSYDGADITATGKVRKQYELWHCQADVSLDALMECGCRMPTDADPKIFANITLCNDTIIRMSPAPLDEGFIYHVMPWQERNGHWAGIGVAEQLETPQRGLNAGIRNLFDNAALSSLPMIVFWKGILTPANGRFELAPGKVWEVADEEMTLNDVQKAITTIEIPTKQAELMEIIALMRDVAQETTGMPLIMQGAGGTGAVGTDQLMTNNASTVLRRLAKDFDSHITMPHIDAYYQWILVYETIKTVEASVHAKGSAVLVERDIQAQALIQMVQMAKDPTYEIDPVLVMEEWLKSQKFDPRKVKMSPERKEELFALMQQPDEKAQAAIQSATVRAEALNKQTEMEAETDRFDMQLKAADAERKREHDKVMLDLKNKYELIMYAQKQGIDLDSAQKQLNSVEVPRLMAESAVSAGADAGREEAKPEPKQKPKKEAKPSA